MMERKWKYLSLDDCYVSALAKQYVVNENGWGRWEKVRHDVKPSGCFMFDLVMERVAGHVYRSCTALANDVGMSRHELTVLFKLVTGMDCNTFLGEWRIMRAKELLGRTSLRIGEVALRSGFLSISSFSLTFIRRCGYSPSTYRKRNRPRDYRQRWSL